VVEALFGHGFSVYIGICVIASGVLGFDSAVRELGFSGQLSRGDLDMINED